MTAWDKAERAYARKEPKYLTPTGPPKARMAEPVPEIQAPAMMKGPRMRTLSAVKPTIMPNFCFGQHTKWRYKLGAYDDCSAA